jgi:UDP-2-acetamido-2,6-beta-L-arabino-hexul-4-ose reductase
MGESTVSNKVVLVTGSNGFIGKNLVSYLAERDDLSVIKYDQNNTLADLKNGLAKADIVIHLAGVNRPQNTREFVEGNSDLTKQIVQLLEKNKKQIPIILSSSIQAELDNDYGKSKKLAEDAVLACANGSLVYRFHNVFGKWCRPNYNSVVATFCNNVATGQEITIDDPSTKLELIYIDDIVKEIARIIDGDKPSEKIGDYCYINPRHKITLGELADTIKDFSDSVNSIYVPKTGDEFVKKLYATYISYVPLDKLTTNLTKNSDDRGSFIELIRTKDSGQFSVSLSVPGVVRGNHYHHTKIERFMVLKGVARINLESIISDERCTFDVNGNDPQIVTIPPGYIHNIENVGDDEMILAIWVNELFDKDSPDTIFKKIKE